jgi:hypothetical protein
LSNGTARLLARRVAVSVEETIAIGDFGTLSLKGRTHPAAVFNVSEQLAPAVSAAS